MKVPASSLAPILRSDTQGRILARLFADPTKRYNLTELGDWVHSSMPTVQREVGRAEQAGIVSTEKIGPTRLVKANPDHPLFDAISQIVLSTYGPPLIVAQEFRNIDGARAVILFGSWAARYAGEPGRAPNDIDVLVIGTAERDAVDDAAERAERTIGVPVQATVRSLSQWKAARDSFIREVQQRPFLVVLTDDDIVGELDGGDARPLDELGARTSGHRTIARCWRARARRTISGRRRPARSRTRRHTSPWQRGASATIQRARYNSAMTPLERRPPRCSPRKASARRLVADTSPSSTPFAHSSTIVAACRCSVSSTACAGAATAPSTQISTPPPSTSTTPAQALATARETVDASKRLLDSGRLTPFDRGGPA